MRNSIPAILTAFALTLSAHGQRSSEQLVLLYDFADASGTSVRDRSGHGTPLDLTITQPERVQRAPGALTFTGDTLIAANQSPRKLIEAVKRSNAISIEAWLQPANTTQEGPARIVTFSSGTTSRNFTLGQEADRYNQRLRTTRRDQNGMPALVSSSRSATTKPTHLLYTRDRTGKARLYINGKQDTATDVPGDFSNWKDDYRFGLGNEFSKDRPWKGSLYLVAVYARALPAADVQKNYAAGPGAKTVVTQPKPLAEPSAPPTEAVTRNSSGLLALYDFKDATGNVVRDRSGTRIPLDLTIRDPQRVRRTAGALSITGDTRIQSTNPATRIIDAARKSGALTIEAWIQPANDQQEGPARIVTLSANSTARNFTLGQEGDTYDVRLRSATTSDNGTPSLPSKSRSVKPQPTHVVYTCNRDGEARLWINGKPNAETIVPGGFANWDTNFRLALGNEFTGERPWLGTYYLVAIYNRPLAPGEIAQHYREGANADIKPPPPPDESAKLFETAIAPLFAKHCIECHDPATREGKLDLSRKVAAMAAGKKTKVIAPGKSAESALWKAVFSDDMPEDRPPLSKQEKAVLKRWIDTGATWTLDEIDPADYQHHGAPGDTYVQRLTVDEYIETVRATFDVDIAREARDLLPKDLRADGFSNTAYNLGVDLKHVQSYAKLAEIAVGKLDPVKFAARFERSRKLIDKDMRRLIERMGAWVLRGPLEGREIDLYRGISTTAASAGGTFEDAVTYILEAMMQSPRFIYRMENQQHYGELEAASPFELASRLSYMIWGASPDAELLDAAKNNQLAAPQQIVTQVNRMLNDPRAMKRAARFAYEWLDLGRMDNLAPNPQKFPDWTRALARDMRTESLAYFVEIAWKQQRPLSDLFNAQVSYATPRLAKHYGLQPQGEGLQRYDVSKVPYRGGLLTQGSVLTIGGDTASMVTRGLFLLHDVLRGVVKPPPPNLDITPIPSRKGLTQRGAAEMRIKDAQCGGCHSKFEPMAFALEKFDGIGAYKLRDAFGNALRDDGEILIPGAAAPVKYSNSRELMDLLAGSERVRKTLTHKIAQFALGRPLGGSDARVLDAVHKDAQKNGGSYQATLRALVKSELVRYNRGDKH